MQLRVLRFKLKDERKKKRNKDWIWIVTATATAAAVATQKIMRGRDDEKDREGKWEEIIRKE